MRSPTKTIRTRSAFAFAVATALVCVSEMAYGTAVVHAQSSPFSGTQAAIPGTIKAVDYDHGGQGIAYWDTTPGNIGGAYRSDDVDIAQLSGGRLVVGWVSQGEWLNYSVQVASSGNYTVTFCVASLGQGGTFRLESNWNDLTGPIAIPDTGGWDTWTTISRTVYLSAGSQVLQLWMDTYGTDTPVGNFDWIRFAGGDSGGGTLRMMTWNVDGGFSDDSQTVYTLPQQVQLMADYSPDVIVLQEVGRWDSIDAIKYRDGLQQRTGRTWYYHEVLGVQCSGGCISMEILSTYPILETGTEISYPTAFGRALINVNGVPINIFTCHLEYWNHSLRATQLLALMGWARSFGGPRLVGGDFNSWWGECGPMCWIPHMRTEHSDSWVDVSGTQEGGHTIGNVRYDYIFRSFDGASRLTPTNAFVIGIDYLSDHRPFVVDFRVQ